MIEILFLFWEGRHANIENSILITPINEGIGLNYVDVVGSYLTCCPLVSLNKVLVLG